MRRPFDLDRRRVRMKLGLRLASLALSLVVAGCATIPRDPHESANEHAGHASTPSDLGHAQSPIDLPAENTLEHGDHMVALHYHKTVEHIIHRQHTVEVEVDPGSTLDFDGRNYILDQFHFHTPSEHLVAGERFPAELHLVHHGTDGGVLVVGILIEMGAHSPFLERILRDTPTELGRVDREQVLDVSELVPAESHFYTYRGSFTTAPFTEGVQWLVLKGHPQASAEQLVRLLVLEGGNARDVQSRSDRVVEDF